MNREDFINMFKKEMKNLEGKSRRERSRKKERDPERPPKEIEDFLSRQLGIDLSNAEIRQMSEEEFKEDLAKNIAQSAKEGINMGDMGDLGDLEHVGLAELLETVNGAHITDKIKVPVFVLMELLEGMITAATVQEVLLDRGIVTESELRSKSKDIFF